jgi:hypothetical protein
VCVYHPAELEEMTKTTRLLPPFTYGREVDTIEAAVLLAASHHAALVPLSLILRPQTRGKGVRQERIQPPKDFLAAVQQKAFWYHVPLERFEVFSGARVQCLFVKVDQLRCDGILLVLRGRNGSVLDAEMIEQRMALRCCCSLSLISLLAREFAWISRLRERISHFRPGHRHGADQHMPRQPALKEQVGQEAALTGHAEVPDLERESMGRRRHLD